MTDPQVEMLQSNGNIQISQRSVWRYPDQNSENQSAPSANNTKGIFFIFLLLGLLLTRDTCYKDYPYIFPVADQAIGVSGRAAPPRPLPQTWCPPERKF